MSDPISSTTQRAAARAFIRTFAQSTRAALVLTAPLGQVVTWGDLGGQAVALAIAVGAAALVGLVAGLQSYLSFIANGVPEDYQGAG